MLFGKLPDDIFRPLSGPNRYIIEKVLKQLYGLFFDETNPDSDAPRKDIVVDEIHHCLVMEDHLALADEEGADAVTFNTPAAAAEYIYRRLIATGWLEIEEDGYHTNIVPNPYATLLLEALVDIEHREKKSYGRVVLSILSHIEAAISSPKDRGLVFLDAVAQTREFSNHLRSILYSLKEVQDLLAKTKDPKEVLVNFFEEFVERILIADYKTLNSADNPFRFRSRIIDHLYQAEFDPSIFESLAEHYREAHKVSEDEARYRLKRDIDYISDVFRSVDQRLAKIDSFCFRLESRVAETVRFIDRTMPGASKRVVALLQRLGEKIVESQEATVPGPTRASQTRLASPFAIYSPRGKKEKPAPQVLQTRTMSPEAKRRKEIIREYMKKRAFEPTKVVDYLNRQMQSRTVMSAGEFVVNDLDDLISFLLIRHLPRMQGKGAAQGRTFEVRREKKIIETHWATCSDFIVTRRGNAK